MNEFEKQDIFLAKMLEDYKVGLITNLIYKPYFDWKQGLIKHSDVPESEGQKYPQRKKRDYGNGSNGWQLE